MTSYCILHVYIYGQQKIKYTCCLFCTLENVNESARLLAAAGAQALQFYSFGFRYIQEKLSASIRREDTSDAIFTDRPDDVV